MKRNISFALAVLGFITVPGLAFAQAPVDRFLAPTPSQMVGQSFYGNSSFLRDVDSEAQRYFNYSYGSSTYDTTEDALGSQGD